MTAKERLAYVEAEMRRVAREDLGIELGDEIDEKTFYAVYRAMQKRGIVYGPTSLH